MSHGNVKGVTQIGSKVKTKPTIVDPATGEELQMYDPWDIIENQAELTGTVPENLIVKETYTFKVRAYEESVMSEEATTAQYNDKTFIYTVLANPSCVSPASNKICP